MTIKKYVSILLLFFAFSSNAMEKRNPEPKNIKSLIEFLFDNNGINPKFKEDVLGILIKNKVNLEKPVDDINDIIIRRYVFKILSEYYAGSTPNNDDERLKYFNMRENTKIIMDFAIELLNKEQGGKLLIGANMTLDPAFVYTLLEHNIDPTQKNPYSKNIIKLIKDEIIYSLINYNLDIENVSNDNREKFKNYFVALVLDTYKLSSNHEMSTFISKSKNFEELKKLAPKSTAITPRRYREIYFNPNKITKNDKRASLEFVGSPNFYNLFFKLLKLPTNTLLKIGSIEVFISPGKKVISVNKGEHTAGIALKKVNNIYNTIIGKNIIFSAMTNDKTKHDKIEETLIEFMDLLSTENFSMLKEQVK